MMIEQPRIVLRFQPVPQVRLLLKARPRKGSPGFFAGVDKIGRVSWRAIPRAAAEQIPDRPWHTSADRRLIAESAPVRHAATFDEAQASAKTFRDLPLTNKQTGVVAVVSNRSIGKMLDGKAVSKSETKQAHAHAVANLDILFERAQLGWSKPDDHGDRNIKAIHRFFAPLAYRGRIHGVKITVKETSKDDQRNPLYTVEAIEFGEKSPAAQWTHEAATRDGVSPRYVRSAGDVLSLARRIEDFNRRAREAEK